MGSFDRLFGSRKKPAGSRDSSKRRIDDLGTPLR